MSYYSYFPLTVPLICTSSVVIVYIVLVVFNVEIIIKLCKKEIPNKHTRLYIMCNQAVALLHIKYCL